MKKLGLEVSICLDMVLIKTFGFDSSKNDISTVHKSRQFKKLHLDKSQYGLCPKVLICLDFWHCLDRDSQSRLSISIFSKPCLNKSRRLDLDLDWSQLLRPPGLEKILLGHS
jgi:hypothetical protein